MHALLGTAAEGSPARVVGRVEEAFDGIAVLARDRAEQAAARAEAIIAPVSGQDPRSADQVAYDAAVAAVDAAVEDASRPQVLVDAQTRASDADAITGITIDLSQAIAAHGDRIDGAQEASALEPLYRAVPIEVTRTLGFESSPSDGTSPPANTPSERGVAGASNLASSGYGGFTWSGQAWAFRADADQQNGFTNGVRSGEQGAFNNAQGEFFVSRSEDWTPESAWFTGAWNAGLTLTFTASRDGVELEPVSVTLGDPTGPVLVSLRALGLTGITSLGITSSGGTRFGFPGTDGGQMFVMDDFSWSRVEAPASRADWTVTYDADARTAQGAAIADAMGALDGEGGPADGGIYAAINALESQAQAIRTLEDADGWEARIQAVLARGRDALQSALEASDGASASQRSIEAEDAETQRIVAVAATLHALAGELEQAFGAEFGFSAGVDADASGEEDRLQSTQAAAQAAATALATASALRAQADELATGAASPLGPELEQWATQVRGALAANPVAADALSDVVGRIDDALATYRLRATDASDAFADYAASAAGAAGTAAAVAGDSAGPIAGVDAPVAVLRELQQVSDDADRSTARIASLLAGSASRTVGGTAIDTKFAEAAGALDALDGEDGSTLGTRTQADEVLVQLNALHGALVGVLGAQGIDITQLVNDVTVAGVDDRLAALRDAPPVGDTAGEPGLVTLAGRVATEVQDGRTAIESASQASVTAADHAQAAADEAAVAAERLATIAADLEARYGSERIEDEAVSANAVRAREGAAAAGAHLDAAAASHAAMVAQFDRIQSEVAVPGDQVGTWAEWTATVGARADQLLAAARVVLMGPGAASGDAEALAGQLEQYSSTNARGAQVFAGLTNGAADAVDARLASVNGDQAWTSGDLGRFRSLADRSASIEAASNALIGAEGAADRADLAADQAVALKGVAEERELDAYRGLQRTQVDPTVTNRDDTVMASVLSRSAADLSAVRRDQAGSERNLADAYQNGTPAVAALRAAWGDSASGAAARDAFKQEVAGHEAALVQADADVNGVRADGVAFDRDAVGDGSLRAQVDFYDTVVQTLAGRVDMDRAGDASMAAGAAGSSEATRSVAIAAARHLAVQANAAKTMATEARTNADRFFGRAMVDYVARAQAAFDRATTAATAADAAAGRAEDHAAEARILVPGGQLVSGTPN